MRISYLLERGWSKKKWCRNITHTHTHNELCIIHDLENSRERMKIINRTKCKHTVYSNNKKISNDWKIPSTDDDEGHCVMNNGWRWEKKEKRILNRSVMTEKLEEWFFVAAGGFYSNRLNEICISIRRCRCGRWKKLLAAVHILTFRNSVEVKVFSFNLPVYKIFQIQTSTSPLLPDI